MVVSRSLMGKHNGFEWVSEIDCGAANTGGACESFRCGNIEHRLAKARSKIVSLWLVLDGHCFGLVSLAEHLRCYRAGFAVDEVGIGDRVIVGNVLFDLEVDLGKHRGIGAQVVLSLSL